MNLDLTEFQELLRAAARDFLDREYPVGRHRALLERGDAFDPELWSKAAGLGWPGLVVSEAYGGGGATWGDLVVLAEELGRALAPTAFLGQFLATAAIGEAGAERQRRELLPALAAGRSTAAVVLDRTGGLTATRVAGGYLLDGVCEVARGLVAADVLVVAAAVDGGAGVFVVDRSAPGITVAPLRNTSGDDIARLVLAGVACPEGGRLGTARIAERLEVLGALIECAYGVGIMACDTEMTIDYVKERVQFGRPIGAFQAVKHQVADMVTDVDCGRLLTGYAAWAVDEGRTGADADVARAKAWVSDALRRVARTGNQLHGGIGFALEYDVHFFFERAKTSELMFGAADDHREKVAAALLD